MDITRLILNNWGFLLANAKCQQIAVEIGGEIMAFINQMMFGLTDKRCGAFAIAYWFWIVSRHRDPMSETTVSDADKNTIARIYDAIRFGPNDLGIDEDFSNPEKMIKFIYENSRHRYFGTLESSNRALIERFGNNFGHVVEHRSLRPLRNGEYAILMVSSDSSINPTHYVLVEKDENGINVIDPVNGIRMNYTGHNIDTLNPGVFGYYNCYTAIYINPVDDKA